MRSQDEEYVVTHGGVTRGFWRHVLGGPPSAVVAAQRINALAGKDDKALFRFGTLVGDREPEPLVGPRPGGRRQQAPRRSWLGHDLPFNQVHGHTSVYEWDAQRWHVDPAVRQMTTRDLLAEHVTVALPGGRLIGIDPGQEALGRGEWRSLELVGHPPPPPGAPLPA